MQRPGTQAGATLLPSVLHLPALSPCPLTSASRPDLGLGLGRGTKERASPDIATFYFSLCES